jgi:uncharacterized protein
MLALPLLGVMLAACTSSPAHSATPSCGGNAPKLTVTGSGMATGTPDLLTIQLTVSVTGPTAQAALADNNSKAAAVITTFEQSGLAPSEVQTTGLTIQPYTITVNGTAKPAGYQVSNTITAKLSDFTKAGATIDAITNDSVQVGSLTFSIKDPRSVEDQARTDAVHQAVSHARSMAAAAGQRLGSVCSLSDTTQTTYPMLNSNAAFATQGAPAPAVPLQAGIQQESAQVNVVYALGT